MGDVDPSESAYEVQASLKNLIDEKDSQKRPLLSVMEGTADKRAVEVALLLDPRNLSCRLLLSQTMKRPQAPHEVSRINPHHRTGGKQLFQRFERC